ncbi:MAG: hypothetical protein IJ147_10810 [Lachnospiraceae bacterium]|nr:hypothetical protein [Lachnospiraceae bacterium]
MKKDKYGNNIDFPDKVLSDLTKKGVIGKWTEYMYRHIKNALCRYYLESSHQDKEEVRLVFENIYDEVSKISFVLQDMISREFQGIDGIFEAVYGERSAELYVWEQFNMLYMRKSHWEESEMWNNCGNDKILYEILS